MRVVLDANVYVSALVKPNSTPDNILELALQRGTELVISVPILCELTRVLFYPRLRKAHKRDPETIQDFLTEITQKAHLTFGLTKIQIVEDDPTDDKYIACAVEGRADFIISGDRHLTTLGEYKGIQIVTPAQFLAIFEGLH